MRILLAFFSLLLCVIISKNLVKTYSSKTKFFVDFNNFNNKMINEINFGKRTLLEILNNVDNDTDFNNSIKQYYNNFVECLNFDYLKQEDVEFFYEYVEFLGKTDPSTQIKQLKVYQRVLFDKVNELKNEEKEKSVLFLKMGLMIGFILFIIII